MDEVNDASRPALLIHGAGPIETLNLFGLDALRARARSAAPMPTGEESTPECEAGFYVRQELPPILDAVEILQEVVAGIQRAETPGGMVVVRLSAGGWRVYPSILEASKALSVSVDTETGMRTLLKCVYVRHNGADTVADEWRSKTTFRDFWQAWEAALLYENETARLPL